MANRGRQPLVDDALIWDAIAMTDRGLTWKEAGAAIGLSAGQLQKRAAKLRGNPYPSSDRDYRLIAKYRITASEYRELTDRQAGKCAICGAPSYRLVVDHCHRTGRVRGLVCDSCNIGLGWVEKMMTIEAEGWLDRAMQYIEGDRAKGIEPPLPLKAGRPSVFTDKQIREAKAVRQNGASWQQAAASIGISVTRLQARIRQLCQTTN